MHDVFLLHGILVVFLPLLCFSFEVLFPANVVMLYRGTALLLLCDGHIVKAGLKDRLDALIGEGPDMDCSYGSSFKSLLRVLFFEPQNAEARSESLLRMRSCGKNSLYEFPGCRTDLLRPLDYP